MCHSRVCIIRFATLLIVLCAVGGGWRANVGAAAGAAAAGAIVPALPGRDPAVMGEAVRGKTQPPRRVVSLVPALTEMIFALGAGDTVVGVSNYCDFPEQTARLARVGTFLAPVVERVLALEPDTVFTSPTPGNENAVRAIERAGIRVVVVENEGSLTAVRRAIIEMADLFGRRRQGEELLATIAAQLQQAGDLVGRDRRPAEILEGRIDAAASGMGPRVAVIVGREPLVLAGPGSYLGELISICGGRNIAAGVGGRWPRVSLEALLALQPDILVDLSMGSESPGGNERLRRYWGRFSSMPAVVHDRLYLGAPNLFQRPGPRVGEAAIALAGMIRQSEPR